MRRYGVDVVVLTVTCASIDVCGDRSLAILGPWLKTRNLWSQRKLSIILCDTVTSDLFALISYFWQKVLPQLMFYSDVIKKLKMQNACSERGPKLKMFQNRLRLRVKEFTHAAHSSRSQQVRD